MASRETMSQGTAGTGVASNLAATHWPALAAHHFGQPTSSPVPGAWGAWGPGFLSSSVSGDWRVWKVPPRSYLVGGWWRHGQLR
jgi:hypothetical protein